APITEENHHQKQSKAAEINNNNNEEKMPSKTKVLSSLENLHDESNISGASKKKEGSLSSSSKKNSLDGGNLGQLHFKLKYSYEKRSLSVVVVRCEGLQSSNKADGGSSGSGLLDPYVKLQLLPEKQHKAKTRVLRKTVSPVYNEEFTFLGIAASSLDNLVVHFVVLNFDRFARDEILGEVVCKVNQLEFDALEKQISLTREIAPRGNKLKIQELGELLVSLCYQPIANRLTVVVLKARNLPKMDLTGLCDPYVKLYVFHNGVRLFKKRTHVKKRTLSPVFNESFVFDIPPEEGLENISLQFQVYDHDRVTRNELIGKVDISGRTPGSPATEKHWHEVIRSPRRQIAEWHKLKEC
ncbi:PREDICTED: synaptotagmin-4-like, partial [Rhagoletis zephyria]|uniref:synaptotagmin-4-like n=1 Tax=Rhagoletis zephyria TaxID=28612 RepID=UPI0008112EEB